MTNSKFEMNVKTVLWCVLLEFILLTWPLAVKAQVNQGIVTRLADSEFVISGIVSEALPIVDKNSGTVCGHKMKLSYVNLLKFRSNIQAEAKTLNTEIEVIQANPLRLNKKVLVAGNPAPLRENTIGKMWIIDEDTGEQIEVNCGGYFSPTSGFVASYSSEISSFRIINKLPDHSELAWEAKVVEVPARMLVHFVDDVGISVESILANGIRGWENNNNELNLCLSRKSCKNEIENLKNLQVEKNGYVSINMSGANYLIDVEAILQVFDAY